MHSLGKLVVGTGAILATTAGLAEEPVSPKFCGNVADTLDKSITQTRVLLAQVQEMQITGLTNRLTDKADQEAFDVAYRARLAMLKAGREFQAAYEDLTYRMRVCSRR